MTYYQMKNRAGDIGLGGAHDALQRIRGQRPADGPLALRIHLAGHSFGCRLVTAAAAGAPGSAPLPVNSLTLLQAAFSHYAFAVAYDGMHDGFYRRVEADPTRVRPPNSEVQRLLASPALAREVLGWEPRVDVRDGLARTIEWIEGNAGRYRVGDYVI